MSYLHATPQALSLAAADLRSNGTAINNQNAVAAGSTTTVTPAAADDVSALTAMQFGAHAMHYQTVSVQAATIRELLIATLQAAAGEYAHTEAANAASVR